MTTVDLSEFLLARIAEDEAVAREATPGPWRWSEDLEDGMESEAAHTYVRNESWPTPVISAHGVHTEGFVQVQPADAAHIARWDPARVLAECQAKARIVSNHASTTTGWHDDEGEHVLYCRWCHRQWPCADLRALALPYADHPNYREEWRP